MFTYSWRTIIRAWIVVSFMGSSLFFNSFWVSAQQTSTTVLLTGEVRSEEGESLPGATLFLPLLNRGTSTDTRGAFTLSKIPVGTHWLVITYIGYKTLDTLLTFDADRHIIFTLKVNHKQLEELFITAGYDTLTASVRSVSILTKEELDRNRGQNLGDMIKHLHGVTSLTTGPSVSKPVIRGLHSQRITLINHGIAQEGQQWGGDHAPEIDPFSPDRIEVIRGAASVEYGVGAIGGVIRVDTDPINKKVPATGTAQLNGYTNNNQGAGSLRIEGGMGYKQKMGYRFQGSYRNAADSQTPRDVLRNSGFRERDYAATLNYEHGNYMHDIYFSHFGTDLGIFRGAHIGNVSDLERAIRLGRPTVDFEASRRIDNPRQEISHNLFRYKGLYEFDRAGKVEFQIGWQENRRKEFDLHRTFGSAFDLQNEPAFDLELTTWTADVKYRHAPTESGFWGTTGITVMKQANVRQTSGALIPNFSSWTTGAFAIEKWSNNTFTAEAGLRLDVHGREVFTVENRQVQEHNFTYASPSFVGGLTYKFTPDWSVSATVSTAWRPPGVNEQFSDGVHHGTAQFEQGNIELDPERSFNTDLTLRHTGHRTYFEFSAYNNRIDNYIFLQPGEEPVLSIRGSFPFFTYEQTQARISGFETTIQHNIMKNVQAGGSVSILRGWDKTNDIPLIFMPSDRFQLFAHYDMDFLKKLSGSYVELKGSLVRRQTHFPKGVDFAPPPDGYKLMNIEAGTDITLAQRNITLSAAVTNLLNSSYRDYLSRFRYFVDDPGRNIILRAQIPLF